MTTAFVAPWSPEARLRDWAASDPFKIVPGSVGSRSLSAPPAAADLAGMGEMDWKTYYPRFLATRDERSTLELTPERWWENPQVNWAYQGVNRLGGNAGSIYRGVTPDVSPELYYAVPDWARSVYGDDARAFHAEYQALSPAARRAFENSLRSQYQAQQADTTARDQAVSTLDERIGELGTARDAFMGDTTVESALRKAAESDLIGPAELAAYRMRIGQQTALARNQASTRAAAAGVEYGGAAIARDEAADALANAANLQLEATVEAANRQARDRAVADLGRYDLTKEGVSQGYEDMISSLVGAKQALQAGVDFIPTDVTVFQQMDWAREQWEQFLESRDSAEEAFRQASEDSLLDVGTWFVQLLDAGALRFLS